MNKGREVHTVTKNVGKVYRGDIYIYVCMCVFILLQEVFIKIVINRILIEWA